MPNKVKHKGDLFTLLLNANGFIAIGVLMQLMQLGITLRGYRYLGARGTKR